jgi:Spy/CpxP family protein refolding chaperone
MIRRTKAAFAAVLTAAALLCIAPASAFAAEQQESPANEAKQSETIVTAMGASGQEGQNAAAQQVDTNASQQQLAP